MDKAPSGLDAALQTDDVLLMIERDYVAQTGGGCFIIGPAPAEG